MTIFTGINRATSTIIMGIKKVKRLIGIDILNGRPQLVYQEFIIVADDDREIIGKFYEDLVMEDEVFICGNHWDNNRATKISVIHGAELKSVPILESYVEDGVKKIIVDLIVGETTEQKFNYDEIMTEYHALLNEYYAEHVIERFKDDMAMKIQIQTWIKGGMENEDVLNELEKRGCDKINIKVECFDIAEDTRIGIQKHSYCGPF